METPIKGRWVVVNTDPFCIGKIVDLVNDIAKIRIDGYEDVPTHVHGRITWIAENIWTLEIPRSAAMALPEAYTTPSPEFPAKFSYFAPDKAAVREAIDIFCRCGYHVTGNVGEQAYFVANISEAGVVHMSGKKYTHLGVFKCRTIDELRILAGFRRPGIPQYHVDPCGAIHEVHGIPDPIDRPATLSEVIDMLYMCREQPTHMRMMEDVPVEPDIIYPTGFIGMELRIPVDGDRKAKATIDSVCGQVAFVRIEDGYYLNEHPDLVAELVYRGAGYELYKTPLHQAIMYDRYMQNEYPAVRVCTPGNFKEHLLNRLKDMGYIIKDTHEGNGPAYLHVAYPYCGATCKCTNEEIVDNSYDCVDDTRLFLSLARQNSSWPYVVDESGTIFKLNADTGSKGLRAVSIHELVPYLRKPLKKAPRLGKCMDCDDPMNAPGDAFTVWNEVWASAKCSPDDMLCPECFEKRLGRPMTIHDLRRVYKEGMNGKRYKVGQLMPINVEFAYTKGWLHE